MGNCSFKKDSTNDKAKAITKEEEALSRNSFNFLYAIGRGGFGKVWKVEKKKEKKIYAMKEMSKVKIYEKRSVDTIITERKLLAHLRHPFIINMHYAFQDRDWLYISMDYLSGGDLRYHLCRRKKKFTEEESKFFIGSLLLSLEYLHSNNVFHRDIKPENLVLDDKGYLYLTDFGIAKIYNREKTLIDSSGTPGYMAPETVGNKNHDLTVDFWAIGIMGYEFMMGKRPYPGRSRKEYKEQLISKEMQLKNYEVPKGWSVQAADFINRCLKRNPKDRLGCHDFKEVKSHPWFDDLNWEKLYKKELNSPYSILPGTDYFDKEYCNKVDPFIEHTYEYYIAKINASNCFKNFLYNYYDKNFKEPPLEVEGIQYDIQMSNDGLGKTGSIISNLPTKIRSMSGGAPTVDDSKPGTGDELSPNPQRRKSGSEVTSGLESISPPPKFYSRGSSIDISSMKKADSATHASSIVKSRSTNNQISQETGSLNFQLYKAQSGSPNSPEKVVNVSVLNNDNNSK